MILATGVAYRKLAAPGVADLTGRGVYYGAAVTEAQIARTRTSSSSAAPTLPARPPCTSPGPRVVTLLVRVSP